MYVDGEAVPTTFVSDVELQATVAADATGEAGSLVIYVENVKGDERTRSNTLYLRVDPAAGAPLVYDYSPDNGVAGDTILIIASNLAGQTLEITDVNGKALKPGTLGTISWPTAGSVDTVEVVLPDGIETGPITVSNGLGSFKGKIFNVGDNLTRIDGTDARSSTQYNTSIWSTASGGDNLLATSFFTANGDCATDDVCTTKPWFSIVSSTSTAYNLTVHNAASPPYSLKAMTFVVVVFLPLVLIYQAWTYYVFRRRVSASEFQPPAPTSAAAPEPEPRPTAPDDAAARRAT